MGKYVEDINEERFDAFLKDLRSGEYRQGTSTLETRDGKFCCLGVACIRPAADGVVERSISKYGTVYYGPTSVDMPVAVADYLGIPRVNRDTASDTGTDIVFFKSGYKNEEGSRSNTAVGFNDSQEKTFAEIADAFELEFTKEV